MTTAPAPLHPTGTDGTPPGIQLFTVEGTAYGPYVGLPTSDTWGPYSAHLFTRATAELIVNDLHRDESSLRAAFDPETGTLTFTDEDDEMEPETVIPDAYGRYLIGGLWPWNDWDDKDIPHTAGQAAFARGAVEYREADASASLPEPLDALYQRGRQEAQLLTRERAEHRGVLFDIDPSRTPLIVRSRPTNHHFAALPPGAYESAARPMLARDVRAGDLVVASFASFPTPGRTTQGTTWVKSPYVADPRPENPDCRCTPCRIGREVCGPGPRVALSAPENTHWGAECDVWEADEPVFVIPAALLLLPVSE
ncbi:hypothetical protein [Streptomyces rimosus]|uniref:hypothetical protein n=1 Tax=Streptomyces rimosus TaxID=1927 RepID=UPI00067BB2B5|nr:hypothetical protein [Streptomyces rimosus]